MAATCRAVPPALAASEEGADALLRALRALADPSRLRIVEMLREREQCVCNLTDALGLSQGTISHHMAALKRAGLVLDRRDENDNRWVYYRLSPSAAELGARIAGLLDGSCADPAPAECKSR